MNRAIALLLFLFVTAFIFFSPKISSLITTKPLSSILKRNNPLSTPPEPTPPTLADIKKEVELYISTRPEEEKTEINDFLNELKIKPEDQDRARMILYYPFGYTYYWDHPTKGKMKSYYQLVYDYALLQIPDGWRISPTLENTVVIYSPDSEYEEDGTLPPSYFPFYIETYKYCNPTKPKNFANYERWRESTSFLTPRNLKKVSNSTPFTFKDYKFAFQSYHTTTSVRDPKLIYFNDGINFGEDNIYYGIVFGYIKGKKEDYLSEAEKIRDSFISEPKTCEDQYGGMSVYQRKQLYDNAHRTYGP